MFFHSSELNTSQLAGLIVFRVWLWDVCQEQYPHGLNNDNCGEHQVIVHLLAGNVLFPSR